MENPRPTASRGFLFPPGQSDRPQAYAQSKGSSAEVLGRQVETKRFKGVQLMRETINQWVNKLIPYLEGVRADEIGLETLPDDPGSCMLVRKGSDELLGELVLDDEGDLRFFSCFRATEHAPVVSLAPRMIRKIAEQFLRSLFEEDSANLQFSSVVDLESIYSVDFVRRDMDGIELPNSGMSFSFWKDGRLLDMTNHLGPLILINEESNITPEAALDLFMANLTAELKISRYDREIYVKGDNEFHLIYDFLTGAPDEVKMDGTVFSLAEELGYTQPGHDRLQKDGVERLPLTAASGIDEMKFVYEEHLDGVDYEVYSDEPALVDGDSRLYDPDAPMEHTVKLITGHRSDLIYSAVVQPEPAGKSGRQRIGRADAFQTAVSILFGEFPDADRLFRLRKEDPELYEDDENGEMEVAGYQFIFDRFHEDIQIEDEGVEINIDARTGKLLRYDASDRVTFNAEGLTEEAPIELTTAKALYMSDIRMRPVRARNENDGGAPVYELVYVPEFPPPGGHVHAVDAHTLEKWTVDTGALLEE